MELLHNINPTYTCYSLNLEFVLEKNFPAHYDIISIKISAGLFLLHLTSIYICHRGKTQQYQHSNKLIHPVVNHVTQGRCYLERLFIIVVMCGFSQIASGPKKFFHLGHRTGMSHVNVLYYKIFSSSPLRVSSKSLLRTKALRTLKDILVLVY